MEVLHFINNGKFGDVDFVKTNLEWSLLGAVQFLCPNLILDSTGLFGGLFFMINKTSTYLQSANKAFTVRLFYLLTGRAADGRTEEWWVHRNAFCTSIYNNLIHTLHITFFLKGCSSSPYPSFTSVASMCRVQGCLRHLRARCRGRLHQHQGAGQGDEDARPEPHAGGAAGDDWRGGRGR